MDESVQRQFDGIWIPAKVYLNTELSWTAKILFSEIHSFTCNGNECFKSNQTLADFLGISIRQVQKHIDTLTSMGWIEQTGFDGRKRYLRSLMVTEFTSDMNKSSRLKGTKVHDTDAQKFTHTNTITNSEEKDLFNLKVEQKKNVRKRRERCLFKNSEFADKQKFIEQFKGTDYEFANLDYYFEAVLNWSNAGGKMKQDWIATARNFMLNDKAKNKLQLNKDVKQSTGNNTREISFLNL